MSNLGCESYQLSVKTIPVDAFSIRRKLFAADNILDKLRFIDLGSGFLIKNPASGEMQLKDEFAHSS